MLLSGASVGVYAGVVDVGALGSVGAGISGSNVWIDGAGAGENVRLVVGCNIDVVSRVVVGATVVVLVRDVVDVYDVGAILTSSAPNTFPMNIMTASYFLTMKKARDAAAKTPPPKMSHLVRPDFLVGVGAVGAVGAVVDWTTYG